MVKFELLFLLALLLMAIWVLDRSRRSPVSRTLYFLVESHRQIFLAQFCGQRWKSSLIRETLIIIDRFHVYFILTAHKNWFFICKTWLKNGLWLFFRRFGRSKLKVPSFAFWGWHHWLLSIEIVTYTVKFLNHVWLLTLGDLRLWGCKEMRRIED